MEIYINTNGTSHQLGENGTSMFKIRTLTLQKNKYNAAHSKSERHFSDKKNLGKKKKGLRKMYSRQIFQLH